MRCTPQCTLEPGDACEAALPLDDPAWVTAVEDHVWGDVFPQTLNLMPQMNPTPCSPATYPWRVLHRFTVGARPQVLDIRVEDSGAQGLDAAVWATAGCGGQVLGCAADTGRVLQPSLVTEVLPAGSQVFITVAFAGPVAPSLYTLRVVRRTVTALGTAPPAACVDTPILQPGVWRVVAPQAPGPDVPNAVACGGSAAPVSVALARVGPFEEDRAVSVRAAQGVLSLFAQGQCGPGATPLSCGAVGARGGAVVESRVSAGSEVRVQAEAQPAGALLWVDAYAQAEAGEACDGPWACAPGSVCVRAAGPATCEVPPSAAWDVTLGPLPPGALVTDGASDGHTWTSCTAEPCGPAAGGLPAPLMWVGDTPGAPALETLTLPPVDVSSLGDLVLVLDHALTGAGQGQVELDADGSGFVTVARWAAPQRGSALLPLRALAAGASQITVRLVFERVASPSVSGGWQVKQVRLWSF